MSFVSSEALATRNANDEPNPGNSEKDLGARWGPDHGEENVGEGTPAREPNPARSPVGLSPLMVNESMPEATAWINRGDLTVTVRWSGPIQAGFLADHPWVS